MTPDEEDDPKPQTNDPQAPQTPPGTSPPAAPPQATSPQDAAPQAPPAPLEAAAPEDPAHDEPAPAEPAVEEPPYQEEPRFEERAYERPLERAGDEGAYAERFYEDAYHDGSVRDGLIYDGSGHDGPVHDGSGPDDDHRPLFEGDVDIPPLRDEDKFAGFGDPEIPMPTERHGVSARMRAQHARDAQKNLDLDLGRIKRRKRYGVFLTTLTVLFVAFVIAPVTWAGIYLFVDPPSTVLMLQRAAEGQSIRHAPVPLTRMSPHIVRAVIAAEDGRFCSHDGFDVEAIQNAMEANEDGGRMRGGSTISQQTAKNLFLWPERSWVRKGFETYFTALIEFMWPKRRIMEAYLNAAEWGDGVFGVEAAARTRFGVAAADLTPLQAARLAAVLPSPNRWSAANPGPYVRRRAASIVQRAAVVRNEHMASCVLALDQPR